MAMRVVTLDRLNDFIKDKTGTEHSINICESSISFINEETSKIGCFIPSSKVTSIQDETPYLMFRDQVSGVLVVDGNLVSDEEIKPYSYLLD